MLKICFVLVSLLILFTANAGGDSTSVCMPSFEKRAYVTTLVDTDVNLLKVKVLYKSLRMHGIKEDVIVIHPENILTAKLQKALVSFGLKTYPITEKMLEQYNYPQGLSIWAFGMVQYERLIYLDPYSLVLENIDELFACVGYCASIESKESPVVLEPSVKTFTSLTSNFRKGSSDFIVNLQQIMNLESCPIFSQQVLMNAETSSDCFSKDHSLLTECHQLPVEYGVLSSSFVAQSIHRDLVCTTCGFEKPKIVMYSETDDRWESFMKTKQAVISKWDNVRSTIPLSMKLRLECLFTFMHAILLLYIILHFYELRFQYFRKQIHQSALSLFEDLSNSNGTSAVWNALTCVNMSPLSPNSVRQGLPAKSAVRLLITVLATTILTSLWYHLSLIVGLLVSSFEWDPLASMAVGYSWSILVLLVGLQLIDHCSLAYHSDNYLTSLLVGFSLTIAMTILAYPKSFHVVAIQVYFSLLAIAPTVWSFRYLSMAKSMLVQHNDVSVLLRASFVYYFLSYILSSFNTPIVFRTVVIRLIGMFHFGTVLYVAISVVCGEHLSEIIRNATLRQRNASLNVVNFFQRSFRCFGLLYHSARKALLQPVVICLLVCSIVSMCAYFKLYLARASVLPSKSPYFCLLQRGKYLNAEGGLSNGCGAREAFSLEQPHDSVFSETFSQNYICIGNTKPVPLLRRHQYRNGKSNWWDLAIDNFLLGKDSFSWREDFFRKASQKRSSKKYLYPSLVVNKNRYNFARCVPDAQFVFILPPEKESKKQYCLYNSRYGSFLTSASSERYFCGQSEKWEVVPTHSYVYIINKAVSVLYPLKYRFTYLNPFWSFCLMLLMIHFARKLDQLPYARMSLYCTVALFFLYLFHVVTIWLIWGINYDNMRQFNTDTMLYFQKALGVLTGPQFYRTVSMLPGECPESLYFTAMIVYSSTYPVFLILLSCIQKRKLSVVDEEFMHYSRDSRDEVDDCQSEKDLNFNISIMSRVASCAIGSFLLEVLFNLVLPVQFIAAAYSEASSCANFEDRFGVINFDKEYLDTVLLFTNVIFLMGVKYSTSPLFFYTSIFYSLFLYIMVWLTVECSYIYFASKFCITTVAWVSLSHKLSSHLEYLVINRGKLGRHRSMPNMSKQLSYKAPMSPTLKQLTRNQSIVFMPDD